MPWTGPFRGPHGAYILHKGERVFLGDWVLTKRWTGPHKGPRGGTFWFNTETSEQVYQDRKPDETQGKKLSEDARNHIVSRTKKAFEMFRNGKLTRLAITYDVDSDRIVSDPKAFDHIDIVNEWRNTNQEAADYARRLERHGVHVNIRTANEDFARRWEGASPGDVYVYGLDPSLTGSGAPSFDNMWDAVQKVRDELGEMVAGFFTIDERERQHWVPLEKSLTNGGEE